MEALERADALADMEGYLGRDEHNEFVQGFVAAGRGYDSSAFTRGSQAFYAGMDSWAEDRDGLWEQALVDAAGKMNSIGGLDDVHSRLEPAQEDTAAGSHDRYFRLGGDGYGWRQEDVA